MTFLIRDSSNRDRQGHTLSVYTQGRIRHTPILHDGFDLTMMSLTFTSLVELVHYFSRKPIFNQLCLQKPAKSYRNFLSEQKEHESRGILKSITVFKELENTISLKIHTLRAGKVFYSFF